MACNLDCMPWASYQIRKIESYACAGNVSPRGWLQRKPLVSDPGMHHDTCVTHVPWCMSGSLTRGGGEYVPGIPSACAPAILCIWQEAHGMQSRLHAILYFSVLCLLWRNVLQNRCTHDDDGAMSELILKYILPLIEYGYQEWLWLPRLT